MALTFWYLVTATLVVIASAKEINYENLEIKGNDLLQSQQQTNPRQYPQTPVYGGFGGMGGGGFGGMGGGDFGGMGGGGFGVGVGGGCPLCDSSVYSYCSYKILHDSCCCDFPVAHLKPHQCFYNDCSLLYAKSCYEYSLIKNCCCNNPY